MTVPTPPFPGTAHRAATAEGSHPVAFRPNPAIVAGAVMGTLLAAAAYVALSGASPVGAHITQVKPLNEASQSSTAGVRRPGRAPRRGPGRPAGRCHRGRPERLRHRGPGRAGHREHQRQHPAGGGDQRPGVGDPDCGADHSGHHADDGAAGAGAEHLRLGGPWRRG